MIKNFTIACDPAPLPKHHNGSSATTQTPQQSKQHYPKTTTDPAPLLKHNRPVTIIQTQRMMCELFLPSSLAFYRKQMSQMVLFWGGLHATPCPYMVHLVHWGARTSASLSLPGIALCVLHNNTTLNVASP